ncbi:S-layer homology domain-containing protein [Paenibacillus sp. NPDC057934]|uniref:S-layer homology domain-containing protein n=1 Tax=Paenibacillus sp. NPDC057934 TaxID=3346282 RepID=UPI0036D84C45
MSFGTMSQIFAASVDTASKKKDTAGHWAENVLNQWQDQGLLKGYEDGSLKPDHKITRAEFTALVNKSFGYKDSGSISFKDVKSSDWFYEEVAKAVSAGYIKGYSDQTFKPNQSLTREEMATIVASLLELKESLVPPSFKDLLVGHTWSKGSIASVVEAGLMVGSDQNFRPLANATRAEAVTVLDRALTFQKSKETVVYDKAGNYGPDAGMNTINGSVYIDAPDIVLNNTIINGDLFIREGVGKGDVSLKNVTVKGTTTITGGGRNSIHIVDSILVTVIVNKKDGSIRIVTEGNGSVQQITLQSGAFLEQAGTNGGFGIVNLSNIIPSGAQVSLAGKFETVDIFATSIQVNLLSGSIQNLQVGSGASNTGIDLASGTSVNQLIQNAIPRITGPGSIGAPVSNTGNPSGGNAGTPSGGNAGNPGGGSNDGNPGTPTSPTNPGNPGTPTNPGNPGTPTNPENPGTPTNPGHPETPTNPGNPGTPTNPENPGTPTNPGNPETPTNPGNPGTVTDTVYGFEGTITDVNDQPVTGMTIHFRKGLGSMTGEITGTVVTDSNGRYFANLAPGIYTGELVKQGFITTYVVGVSLTTHKNLGQDATAIKIPAADEIRIVLTWGYQPFDEDSHLVGPTPNNRYFHTWYSDRKYEYNGQLYADLDHDDVDSYGPETTTIRKRIDGTYTFYVHNYSGNGPDNSNTLAASDAKVEIYNGNNASPVKTYHIPAGEGKERYWYVFDMTVNGAELTFEDKNELTNSKPKADADYDNRPISRTPYYQDIYMENNPGANDTLKVRGLSVGDIVTLYLEGSQTSSDPVGPGSNTAELNNLDFGVAGSTVSLSVTSRGSRESNLLQVEVLSETNYAELSTSVKDAFSDHAVPATLSVGEAVYLADPLKPLPENLKIKVLGIEPVSTVNQAVYLEKNFYDGIILAAYNGSKNPAQYKVNLELRHGSSAVNKELILTVPTVYSALTQSLALANQLLDSGLNDNRLLHARDFADQVLQDQTASTFDYIDALIALNSVLKGLI